MTDNQVELCELNAENWHECIGLEVAEHQSAYIQPNAVSIAQSKFEPTLVPMAIHFEGKPAGFLMYNTVEEELGGYWIYRIMVDKSYQRRGIAKKAAQLMIDKMRELPGARKAVIGYHPENTAAHNLYRSLGFVDHGDRFGKEMAVVLDL